MIRTSLGLLLPLVTAVCSAGEYNTVLNIGDAAPAWSDLPAPTAKSIHWPI